MEKVRLRRLLGVVLLSRTWLLSTEMRLVRPRNGVFTLINLTLHVNSHRWLLATMLDSIVLGDVRSELA